MFNTIAAGYRKRVLPANFDARPALEVLRGRLADPEIRTDPDFIAVVNELLPEVIAGMIARDNYLPIERARAFARLALIESDTTDRALVAARIKARALVAQDLPSFLQFAEAQSQTYRIEERLVDGILSGEFRAPVAPVSMPHPAFEVSWESTELAFMFSSVQEFVTGRQFQRHTDMRGANLCMRAYQIDDPERGPQTGLLFKVFTPNDHHVTERALPLMVPQGATIGEIQEGCLSFLSENGLASRIQADSVAKDDLCDLLEYAFTSVAMISREGIGLGPAINPRRVLSARVTNSQLPKKQRERAREAVSHFPDAVVRLVTASGEAKKVDLSPPVTGGAGERTVLGIRKSDAIALGAEMLTPPGRISRTFPGIGEGGRLGELLLHRLPLEDPYTGEGELLGEGVKMDKIAIDVPPHIRGDMQYVMKLYQGLLFELPVADRPKDLVVLQGLINLHAACSDYQGAGSQCFMLNGSVAELLAKTDIDSIGMNDLDLPYSSFFLGFEEPASLEVDGGPRIFEGAFISKEEGEIQVLMTFAPGESSGKALGDFVKPLTIRLPVADGVSVADAVIRALESNGYDLDRGEELSIDPEVLAEAERLGVKLSPAEQSSQSLAVDRNEQSFDTVVDALGIIANALILLSAPPPQVSLEGAWDRAPKFIRDQLELPDARQRRLARSRVTSLGLLPARVITLTDEARAQVDLERESVRGSPSVAYWRRGHWRSQAYGAGRKLRKMVWVQPTLCNAETGLIAAGSVYRKDIIEEDSPSP